MPERARKGNSHDATGGGRHGASVPDRSPCRRRNLPFAAKGTEVACAGHTGLVLTQRMHVQKAENDARSCGNENSATQRFSPERSFNPVQTGGIQTDNSMRSVSTVENSDNRPDAFVVLSDPESRFKIAETAGFPLPHNMNSPEPSFTASSGNFPEMTKAHATIQYIGDS